MSPLTPEDLARVLHELAQRRALAKRTVTFEVSGDLQIRHTKGVFDDAGNFLEIETDDAAGA